MMKNSLPLINNISNLDRSKLAEPTDYYNFKVPPEDTLQSY